MFSTSCLFFAARWLLNGFLCHKWWIPFHDWKTHFTPIDFHCNLKLQNFDFHWDPFFFTSRVFLSGPVFFLHQTPCFSHAWTPYPGKLDPVPRVLTYSPLRPFAPSPIKKRFFLVIDLFECALNDTLTVKPGDVSPGNTLSETKILDLYLRRRVFLNLCRPPPPSQKAQKAAKLWSKIIYSDSINERFY